MMLHAPLEKYKYCEVCTFMTHISTRAAMFYFASLIHTHDSIQNRILVLCCLFYCVETGIRLLKILAETATPPLQNLGYS